MSSSTSLSRALLPAFLALLALLAVECALRLAWFGSQGVLRPWRYTPQEAGMRGFTESTRELGVGRRLRPGVNDWLKGVPFRTNAAGFREREVALERAAGVVRIAVLGGSIELGSGVARAETYSQRFQRDLDRARPGRFEVLNFAVSGYQYPDAFAAYGTFVAPYGPDVVLLPLYPRQAPWLHAGCVREPTQAEARAAADAEARKGRRPRWLRAFARATQLRSALEVSFAYRALRRAAAAALPSWLRRDWDCRGLPRAPIGTASWSELFEPFLDERRSDGTRVLLVTMAELSQLEPPASLWDPAMAQLVDEARRWSETRPGVFLIDTRERLAGRVGPHDYTFYGDHHPNAHWHAETAAALFESIAPRVDELAAPASRAGR